MKRVMIAAGAAALACAGFSGHAQELRLPQSDYEMNVRIQDPSGDGEAQNVEMRHRSGDFRMDGQFQGQPAIVLVNPVERRVTILADMGGNRVAIRLPVGDDIPMPVADERFGEVVGQDTVAGEACTVYRIEDENLPDGAALGCMTDDNIILRVADTANTPMMEAVSFSRRSQEPALFTVPEGYQVMDMSGQ